MGLCYVGGFQALTLALVGRLPGDIAPLEGLGVINQQESVAGLSSHSLLTAFPLSARGRVCVSSLAARGPMERRASASLWQACPDTVLQRRVAMKVAFPGGLSVPEGQVPLSISTLASALQVEQGTIGTDPGSIGPKSRLHRPSFPHFPHFPRFPHLIFSTVHVCSVPPPVRNKRNKWNRNIGQNLRLVLFRSVE